MDLKYVEICSLYMHFQEIFHHKLALNFVKIFYGIYWNCHMIFIFQYVYVVYHSDWFVDIENSLHPLNESHLIMV